MLIKFRAIGVCLHSQGALPCLVKSSPLFGHLSLLVLR